ncbi:PH domain-containing protein [Granulicella sp. S190]|jgi:hypothetical protein|uniref:PH domain-containing protein n=1 Tax=Granulicella sp. S190 TaxID=1747226 RepID=UPI00131D79E1|nr:PH domain-containing protein [Granulicella sp. S190]
MISRFQPARLTSPVIFVLALMILSYWLNPEAWRHLSLLTESLFAFFFLTFAVLTLAMRSHSYLRIDEHGLEIKYLTGAPRLYPWADIESARIVKKRILLVPVLSSIALKLRQSARPSNTLRRSAGSLVGYDVTFLAVYDESAQEILEKIQSFTRQH